MKHERIFTLRAAWAGAAACAGAVLCLIAGLALAGCGGKAGGAPQATPVPLPATNEGLSAEGKLEPVQSAGLASSTGGVVAEVLAPEGAQVTAGQPLLRFRAERQAAAVAQAEAVVAGAQGRLAQLKAGPRPQELAMAQSSVDNAQAQLDRLNQGPRAEEIAAAEAELAAAQAGLAKVRESASQQDLIAANADLANAQAAVRQAQAAYDRVKGDPSAGARPEALVLEQATNNLTAAQARYNALAKGPSAADVARAAADVRRATAQRDLLKAPARPADIAAAEAELRRAQAALDLLRAGTQPEAITTAETEVSGAQAALAQAQAALAELEVRAPFSATVDSITPHAGEYVAPGTPIAWLAGGSEWQVETTDLTELSVAGVHEGDAATVTFDALPDLTLPGKVTHVKNFGQDHQGDIVYTVVVTLGKSDPRLRWNMTAKVGIVTGR